MSPSKSASPSGKSPDPLDLDGFIDPDDQGLSLDELSRAYAAILNKGADPYAQADHLGAAPSLVPAAIVEPEAAPPEHDDHCEIVPKTILEAMLFVGHPANEPLASERIAALMRGVRPEEIDELVTELNAQYEREGCPYTIVSVDLGYQLALKPEFAPLRDVFYGSVREARLS